MENNDTVPTMPPSSTKPKKESRTTLGGVGDLTKQQLSESDQSLTKSAKKSDRKSNILSSMNKFLGEDEEGDFDGYSVGKASEHSQSSSVQQRKSSTMNAGCTSPVKSTRKKSYKKPKSSFTDGNEDEIKIKPRKRSGTNSSTGKKNKDRLSTGEDKSLSEQQLSKEGDNDLTKKLEEISRKEKPKRKDCRSVASTHSKSNEKNLSSENDETFGEDTLNDQKRIDPGKSVRNSAKKLLDRAVRAASPGRLRRATSPGRLRRSSSKIKSSMRSLTNNIRPRSISPDNSDTKLTTKNTSKSPKQRPKSPGRLKKRIERESSGGRTKSRPKKRPESPGALKKRSESPGRLKKRVTRKPSTPHLNDNNKSSKSLGAMLEKDAATKSKRRESRSVASAPMKKPQRQKSNDGLPQQKVQLEEAVEDDNYDDDIEEESSIESTHNTRDEMPSKPRRLSTEESSPPGDTGTLTKEESYSNMKNELTRHKIRRNKCMATSPSPANNNVALKKEESYSNMKNELARQKITRNKSMMASPSPTYNSVDMVKKDTADVDKFDELARYKIRRNKSMGVHREGRDKGSTSPADLVQYTEEEIHSTSYFASNHVLINRERMKRGLKPYTRNIAMDDVARKSALAMAESNGLNPLPATYVGNVLRGESIRSIHRSTMLQKQGRERENLLNPYFQDFGVGTAKGEDGMLYMCQLFSERLELALTDTVSEQNEPKSS
mmetsp:Transcript_3433/g.3889  ORF Transcript_3433/g.3889 Transcript_3433/m.3889 type:complete len:719 (-) Transcript_3433:91-2247(-)